MAPRRRSNIWLRGDQGGRSRARPRHDEGSGEGVHYASLHITAYAHSALGLRYRPEGGEDQSRRSRIVNQWVRSGGAQVLFFGWLDGALSRISNRYHFA